jgi:hypothetical protein
MNWKCFFSHKWNGCKCERCGNIRDENHKFVGIPNKCEEKCSICGKTNSIPHKYKLHKGKCEEICETCGDIRTILHKFDKGVCTNCGVLRSELGTPDYVSATEIFPVINADLVQYIVSSVAVFLRKGDWQLLEPACKKYAETFATLIVELNKVEALKEGYGDVVQNLAIREYISEKFNNGDFNLKTAKKRMADAAFDRRWPVHPGSVHEYLKGKMTSIFQDIKDNNKMLLLPNMTVPSACDIIIDCIIKDKSIEKLVEIVYQMSLEYVKKEFLPDKNACT